MTNRIRTWAAVAKVMKLRDKLYRSSGTLGSQIYQGIWEAAIFIAASQILGCRYILTFSRPRPPLTMRPFSYSFAYSWKCSWLYVPATKHSQCIKTLQYFLQNIWTVLLTILLLITLWETASKFYKIFYSTTNCVAIFLRPIFYLLQ